MKKKYIIPIYLLLAACSSNETLPTTDVDPEQSTDVAFSASISGGGSTGRADDETYKHNQFLLNTSRIRVVNTVNYSTPDFTDVKEGETPEYKEYIYTKENISFDDNKVNFTPYEENGFNWNDIRPTAASFIFEAACYPMAYEYFSEVATDQRTRDNFWKADLLLAHHAQPLNQRYDLVKLKFHHVFAMVRVEIDLPISDPYDAGGFPEDAITNVELVDMLVGYHVDYTSAITNDGCRNVTASGNKRADISMYCLKRDEPTNSGGIRTQHYEFCGIVPVQSIMNKDLVRFTIQTYTDEVEGDKPVIDEDKTYIFHPGASESGTGTNTIYLSQEHITVLELSVTHTPQQTILLNAKIQPWDNAYTEMDMSPVTDTGE